MQFGRQPIEVELPGGEVLLVKATSRAQGILMECAAGREGEVGAIIGAALQRFDEILASGAVVGWKNVGQPFDPAALEEALDSDEKVALLNGLAGECFSSPRVDAALEAGAEDPTT